MQLFKMNSCTPVQRTSRLGVSAELYHDTGRGTAAHARMPISWEKRSKNTKQSI